MATARSARATAETLAWIAHVRGAKALERAVCVADAAAIPLLPVKGILTARLFYPDVAARPLADVDVRVPARDAERFMRAGLAAGWRLDTWSRPYRNAVFDVAGAALDVESAIGPPGLCLLSIEDLVARSSVVVEPFGFRHRQPELHDHAIVLAVNAFKDKMSLAAPHAISDLERIVLDPRFRPATLVERAARGAVTTLLWIVADWMSDPERARPNAAREAWREVRDRIGARPPRAAYAAALRVLLTYPGSLATRIATRFAADDAKERARSLAVAAWWSAARRSSR
jgi:hypothetical protein